MCEDCVLVGWETFGQTDWKIPVTFSKYDDLQDNKKGSPKQQKHLAHTVDGSEIRLTS